RDKSFKESGTRWFEFARLPHFDAVRMTVVDPMHNLLIGVIKNHWYATWIVGHALRSKTSRVSCELDLAHKHPNSFKMPAFVGRPAKQVGEPAGRGLSTDTYKSLGTIPIIWHASLPAAMKEYDGATASFEKRMAAWESRHGATYRANIPIESQAAIASNRSKNVAEPPKPPEVRMNPGEDRIFLKLTTATKIYMQYEITNQEITRAELYGPEKMKPKHHYVVHLPAQIRDYGPVYGFWCFLGERLNKILKSFKSNNWGGGQLEVSMIREWGRDVQLHETVCGLG
ncbi:hypothetical protein JB92DRAFT_2771868, partial [Gautieria morchelliformis]